MILLDTNVLTDPMAPRPHPAVAVWLDAQHAQTLYVSTISVGEIRYGIAALPEGRRRSTLRERFEDEVLPFFDGRVLSFDEPAAAAYGQLRASMRSRGRAIGDFDALIAATALSRRLTVATRDTSPFSDAGVSVLNPYET
ncbi:MAG TPA: type II toxin-antitoxin system VapC family toxin [Arachnia sp.]|nr:type II toxin-antitoxin system VapC family toxin [Arachnia sp.]HMT86948.1 type II toxin-antitoxin system VapC family toxin [Arachnia sp.]